MTERKYLGVIGHKDLVRDANSRGILSVDNDGLNKYKEERALKQKMKQMIEEHDDLKNEIKDIKSMLLQLLERK